MDIKFNVDNTVLTRVDDTPLVEGTMNYLYAVFEFTAEWENMPKTVVFSHEDELEQVILKDDKCLIPTEIIKPTQFEVTVYSGNKLITNKYTVNVYTNYPEHPPEPTPNVYEQIVTWIHNLENRVTIVELNIIHGGGVIDLVGLYPVAPEAGVDGQYYFNTLENKLYQYAVDRWMENATMLSKNRLYVTPSDGFVYYYDEPTISPITSMSELKFEVVDELPEVGKAGIIYLLKIGDAITARNADGSENTYEEYIWLESGRYELLGTTDIDLSNYYNKDEIDALIRDTVKYKSFSYNGETRKTIELANYDTISGLDTNGVGHNLAQVSKWDVADLGAPALHLNLNTKDNVTINDDEIVATTSDLDVLDKKIDQAVEDIKNGLNIYVTLDGNETLTNKVIDAEANQISNLKVTNFSPDSVAINISAEPSDDKFPTEQAVKEKFDAERLRAGENIRISGNVISAVAEMYEAGENIEISGNVISARGLNYQAGANIEISGKTISATGIPNYINDLKDVDLGELKNGQLLGYNSVTSKWENMTPSGGTQYTASGYVHISDENVITVDLSSKQDKLTPSSHIRIWNYQGTTYISANLKTTELDDVSVSELTGGQILVYNDVTQRWENTTPSGGTLYSAGNKINISAGNAISVDDAFIREVEGKQDKLIAGDNIEISGNRISALADITAENVEYINGDYRNVKEALDSLLYIAPVITSFTGGGTYEAGTIVTNVTLNWAYNKVIKRQEINQGIGELAADVRTHSVSDLNWGSDLNFDQPSTMDRAFTLNAWDEKNKQVTRNTTVSFSLRRYAGESEKTELTDEDIQALRFNELSRSRSQTRTFNCSGGKYFYFAIPTRYCSGIKFVVGGLAYSDLVITTRDFVNKLGFTESYNIYRSGNIQTGSEIKVEVS